MSTLRVNNVSDLGLDAVVTNGVVVKGALPSGSVLQVVSTTKNDPFSMTGSTFTTPTGFSASITPSSATSKILVFVDINMATTGNNPCVWRVRRDTTAIAVNSISGWSGSFWNLPNVDNGALGYGFGLNHVDSPATTSAITYDVQIRSTSTGLVGINRCGSDTSSGGVSTITLMEIAG